MNWVYILIAVAIFFYFMDMKNDKEFSEYANNCNAAKNEYNDYELFVAYGCGGKADWDAW